MQRIQHAVSFKRTAQSFWLSLTLFTMKRVAQAKLLGEVLLLLAKAFVNKMFRAQVLSAVNIDVDGFRNVHMLEAIPSVTAGFVRLNYVKTVNGYEKTRTSTLVTDDEWERLARRAAFGGGRLA